MSATARAVLAAAFVVAPVTALAALTAVLLMASAAWLPAALGKDACSRRFKVSALSSAVAVSSSSAPFMAASSAGSARLTATSPGWGAVSGVRTAGVDAVGEDGATSSGVTGACGAVRSVLSVLTRSPYACTR